MQPNAKKPEHINFPEKIQVVFTLTQVLITVPETFNSRQKRQKEKLNCFQNMLKYKR